MVKTGQIDLFTKRIRKLPPVPERALHIAVADTLRVSIAPGWLWFHPANGELRSDKTGALLQRMGVKPGVSDICLVGPPAGHFHALELKRLGGKLTEEQRIFMTQVTQAGGVATWADTYEDAIKVLKDWGALSTRLHT